MAAEKPENASFIGADPSSIRLQWTGGFYPSGAIIALELRAGDAQLVKVFNPAIPDHDEQLYRYSKSNRIAIEGVPESALPLFHGSMARQELRALMEKARAHLARCRRLDWEQTEQLFRGSASA